jgi:hypothetical protein
MRALLTSEICVSLSTHSLKKHAETKLKPSCSPSNLHLCDDAKKAEVLVRICARNFCVRLSAR